MLFAFEGPKRNRATVRKKIYIKMEILLTKINLNILIIENAQTETFFEKWEEGRGGKFEKIRPVFMMMPKETEYQRLKIMLIFNC